VIANNIANVNTVGFKASKTYFGDVLSQSISGGSSGNMQVGRGVMVTDIATQFGPGSFETTGNATDVSIDGDGFFMVNDTNGATYYTRAGAFHMDNEGYLVDVNGYRVQGYNLTGASSTTIDDIALANVQSAPKVTSTFSFGLNLNAEEAKDGTFNCSQTVYDSLGAAHTLNVKFTKKEENGKWGFVVSLDGTAATAQGCNEMKFDGAGKLTDPAANFDITFGALSNGATIGDAGKVTWDMKGSSITGYASTSVIRSLSNDGYASGILRSLSIDGEGKISGFFTNGQTSEIAQLVLADFENPWGLKKMGSNLFGETITSGPAIKNVPGASGMGEVKSNCLEMSNVDIATEFINMITAQKAYQANARVITTQDQVLTELMNIKR
ncbi:MAG: flagellar hook protein FlgE, partial [Syntrophobacterales bacterium]|nr:flagellar hook protein FlgE [Syntrophobacterales bacterium]